MLVVHDQFGVAPPLQGGDLAGDQLLGAHVGQLGQPGADVGGVGVEFGGLGGRVEDPQGLGIHATAGAPLPAAVVGGQIPIHQVFHEGCFTQLPVADQVFHQVGGHDHAAAVVHPAAGRELAHGGIDDRHAGEAIAPGGEALWVIFPGKVAPLGPVGPFGQLGEMEQGLLVELAPGQFLFPHGDGFAGLVAAGQFFGGLGRSPGLARAEGAEGQGGTEDRGAGFAWDVAPLAIGQEGSFAALAFAKELQLLLGGGFPGPAGAQGCALKTMVKAGARLVLLEQAS